MSTAWGCAGRRGCGLRRAGDGGGGEGAGAEMVANVKLKSWWGKDKGAEGWILRGQRGKWVRWGGRDSAQDHEQATYYCTCWSHCAVAYGSEPDSTLCHPLRHSHSHPLLCTLFIFHPFPCPPTPSLPPLPHLSAGTTQRLVNHDAAVGHGVPLALPPSTQQESTHGSCQPKAVGLQPRQPAGRSRMQQNG